MFELERIANAISKAQMNEDRKRLLDWLRKEEKSINPSTFRQEASKKSILANTGGRILEDPEFVQWQSARNSFLWLHDKVGAGKSVLSAKIIDHLEESHKADSHTAVVYFYMTHKEENTQDRVNLTISLMLQLFSRRPDTPQALLDLRRHQDTGLSPPIMELDKALATALRDFENVYLIIDGLDECPNAGDRRPRHSWDERKAMLKFLTEVQAWNLSNVHIAIISRPEPDITGILRLLLKEKSSFAIDLSTSPHAGQVKEDMLNFIESELQATQFDSVSREQKDVIKIALVENANGMFQYIGLQMSSFGRVVTANSVDKVLRNPPSDLDETYDRALHRLSERDRPRAICVLRWVVFSGAPLPRSKLLEAILTDMAYDGDDAENPNPDYSKPPFDEGDRFDASHIKNLFPGLLEEQDWEIDEWGSMVLMSPGRTLRRDPVVVLTHFYLHEYLTSGRLRDRHDNIRDFALDRSSSGSSKLSALTCFISECAI
ncbi:hypothetical protein B0H63DRAFT_77517 [Podospora didyma]|uniref:Nephrocystin 3-like N-terminal domain-containing protein n=1 Tax=Podospora didyma TaxID=330526 RepID=A0AAE0K1U2_9PEZI|nr:hypothetical protein B0H63DRAFT_77517 [Podospora didyma]